MTSLSNVHLYVDDSTLSEVLQPKSSDSDTYAFLINLLKWTESNDMQLNASKTKEMILRPLAKSNLPLVSTTVGTIDSVTSFKLLGVHIDSTLSWTTHVNNIIKSYLKA